MDTSDIVSAIADLCTASVELLDKTEELEDLERALSQLSTAFVMGAKELRASCQASSHGRSEALWNGAIRGCSSPSRSQVRLANTGVKAIPLVASLQKHVVPMRPFPYKRGGCTKATRSGPSKLGSAH